MSTSGVYVTVMPLDFAYSTSIWSYPSVMILLLAGSVGELVGAWIAYAIGKYGGDPFIIHYGK